MANVFIIIKHTIFALKSHLKLKNDLENYRSPGIVFAQLSLTTINVKIVFLFLREGVAN